MPKEGAPIVVTIPFNRTTAGTHLYKFKSFNKEAPIQNVYVSKDGFESPTPPAEVEVTIKYKY